MSDQSLKRPAFNQMLSGLPTFATLQAKVGFAIAAELQGMYFEDNVRIHDVAGYWEDPSRIPKNRDLLMIIGGNSVIKVKSKDYPALQNCLKTLCQVEDALIDVRQKQVAALLKQARGGQLGALLAQNLEPAASYFAAPAAPVKAPQWRQVAHGRYEKAAPQAVSDDAKALAWITKGVKGDLGSYREMLDQYVTKDGTLPLSEKILTDIWRTVAGDDAPRYRMTVQGSLYPSSVGGAYLLKKIFELTQSDVLPARGQAAWADWAVFYFGALMNIQAFTDGNKRVARLAYGLVMVSAGIPFEAPTAKWGETLAKM